MGKGAGKGKSRLAPTYYQNYILREDEHAPAGILSFQTPYGRGARAHSDELLFIAIHQTYELWFKVAIDEILRANTGIVERIKAGHYVEAAKALRRLARITTVLRDQYEIVGTITPTDFLVFRDVLRPSSGYDSAQFRALELSSGLRGDGGYLRHLTGLDAAAMGGPDKVADEVGALVRKMGEGAAPKGAHSVAQKLVATGDLNGLRLIHRSLASDSLRDAAYHALLAAEVHVEGWSRTKTQAWLKARMREWSADQAEAAKGGPGLEVGVSAANAAQIELTIAGLYHGATRGGWDHSKEGALLGLVEALMDYDQAFRNLRTIHINMVLRVIGGRPGTGGSSGARYLRSTLDYEFFPLLWRARDHIEGP